MMKNDFQYADFQWRMEFIHPAMWNDHDIAIIQTSM